MPFDVAMRGPVRTTPPLEVVAIGDSLTTGFRLRSPMGMLWHSRVSRCRSWFVDRSGRIDTLSQRIATKRSMNARQYATVSARVDSGERRTLADRLMAVRHFSHQVSSITALHRMPDMVLLWIGHNNLDWAQAADYDGSATEIFSTLTDNFVSSYERQLLRLINYANSADHAVIIVVFGLIDFRQFFIARELAEQRHSESPNEYARLVDCYSYFPSLKPEYRSGVIQLSEMINERLAAMTDALNQTASLRPTTKLRYSSALHDADISSVQSISDIDAWHPSTRGHNALAASAYAAIASLLTSELRRDCGFASSRAPGRASAFCASGSSCDAKAGW